MVSISPCPRILLSNRGIGNIGLERMSGLREGDALPSMSKLLIGGDEDIVRDSATQLPRLLEKLLRFLGDVPGCS